MDAQAIPFVAEFDLIAACDVLEHIEQDEAVLAEIFRALKPGGGLLLTVPQHPALWSKSDEVAHHRRRYRRRELAGKARRAGFDIIADTSFVFTLLPAMILQRLLERLRPSYDVTKTLALPSSLDKALEFFLDFERALIYRSISLPLGGSRLVVARRR